VWGRFFRPMLATLTASVPRKFELAERPRPLAKNAADPMEV